jgi:hypothetical protein
MTWFQEHNFLACMCTQLAFIHDCEMLAESRRLYFTLLYCLYKLHTTSVMFTHCEQASGYEMEHSSVNLCFLFSIFNVFYLITLAACINNLQVKDKSQTHGHGCTYKTKLCHCSLAMCVCAPTKACQYVWLYKLSPKYESQVR